MTVQEKNELLQLKEREAIRRCRNDFYYFLKYMSPIEFNWNWHHEYVCNVLQNWIKTDEHPFLMIFMPPQHQKSTMMTEFLPSWAFGQSIDYQSLLVMYNATMAKKYNRKIQRIMGRPEYAKIFPKTKLNEKNVVSTTEGSYVKNSEEFEIVGGRGFLKAVGVDGGIAGNPAKLTFMDDVIKNVREANSETYRNNIWEWYTDELEARQHNDSKIAFTITRRHDDDLAGRLIKRDGTTEDGGKWKVITLPALREDLDNVNDPRMLGEALFPSLHSKARLDDIKKKSPRTFEGLYQQRPTAKGGDLIKGEYFVIKKPAMLPFNMDDVVWDGWIDGAFTDKSKNDPSAFLYTYFDKVNKILYIRRCTTIRKLITDAVDFFELDSKLAGLNHRSLINIEMKSSGAAFKDMLWRRGHNCKDINNDTVKLGKITRVMGIESFLIGGRIVLVEGNWNKGFIKECESFPNGKHDDQVDLLCYSVYGTLVNGGNPYIKM